MAVAQTAREEKERDLLVVGAVLYKDVGIVAQRDTVPNEHGSVDILTKPTGAVVLVSFVTNLR